MVYKYDFSFRISIVNYFCTLLFQTGTTALFFAAQGGFLDIVRLLLENNAPVGSASVVSILFILSIIDFFCGERGFSKLKLIPTFLR